MTILMKDLDKPKVEDWLDFPGKYGLSHEPAFVFVCAWIAFNYVYGLYCRQNKGQLLTLAKKASDAKAGDRQQWEFFVGQRDFETIFNEIKLGGKSKHVFDLKMPRRIIDLLWDEYHPRRDIVGAFQLRTLTALELFDLLYAVRNNLFHGGKKADSNEDRPILEVAASFLTPFMRELLDHIKTL